MAKVYKVASPTLALKLANKFKQQGIYDLFRGQNEDWPLVASIKRLSIKKQEDAIGLIYPWTCDECGEQGNETYELSFTGHYHK